METGKSWTHRLLAARFSASLKQRFWFTSLFFFTTRFVVFKTPMGLEPFEVRFFIGKKFTKFDLAVQQDIKNRSKGIWRLFSVFFTIWTKPFFCQKSYGNTTPFKLFHTIFFSVRVSGPGRYPNENLFLYDQISSYMILLKWGNFFVSNLLWVYKGLKFIFERFFRLFWSGSKVDWKWL